MADNRENDIHQLSQVIASLIERTFDPNHVVTAGNALEELKTSKRQLYGLATLYLTRRADLSMDIKLSAASAFKNFVKQYWPDETSMDVHQRDLIKQNITQLMLESPELIQRQLSEAITIIGRYDFPEKWPSLIVEFETSLKNDQNISNLHGVLRTAHSIFGRYRHEFASDRLWSEIKFVIEHFAQPFTIRFKDLVGSLENSPQYPETIYQSLLLCTKIYRSLITQDLPEFFEDRINEWLPLFLYLLNVPKASSKDIRIHISEMKAEICEIASLFVQRFSNAEDFKGYTEKFAQIICNILATTNQDMQTENRDVGDIDESVANDTLASTAIRFLVTVASRPEFRSLFENTVVLNQLCESLIIPNLKTDEYLFENDHEEYIKRDMEESDTDTRRRAACDLVQTLSKFVEVQLIEIFSRHIVEEIKNYELNKISNWKNKDLAIFLYIAIAKKGSTRKYGASISPHVSNLKEFLELKVIEELSSDARHLGSDILKADALKYITTFRSHISINTLVQCLPSVINLIISNNVVLRTYASITIEKLLTMRNPSQPRVTIFKSEHFEPHLGNLVKNLFDALEMPEAENTHSENEHIMRAIMRLFSFTRPDLIVEFLPVVVPKMTQKLNIVASNPRRPQFNHTLFETFALIIKAAGLPYMNDFENLLFNILDMTIAREVEEFTPYVLQLLNLVFQTRISERSEQFYRVILPPLQAGSLWERRANILPLTDLVDTFIVKMASKIESPEKLQPLLEIFRSLIFLKKTGQPQATETYHQEASTLLQTMMIHLPAAVFDACIGNFLGIIFSRLSESKKIKTNSNNETNQTNHSNLVKNVLVCLSLYAYLRGADQLATAVNQVQADMFGMIIENFNNYVKDVTGQLERKICMCGIIKILAQLPLIDNGQYKHLWTKLLMVLMEMFDSPPDVSAEEDEYLVEDPDLQASSQARYAKLIYASVRKVDPTHGVDNLKSCLALSMRNLSNKLPDFPVPRELLN